MSLFVIPIRSEHLVFTIPVARQSFHTILINNKMTHRVWQVRCKQHSELAHICLVRCRSYRRVAMLCRCGFAVMQCYSNILPSSWQHQAHCHCISPTQTKCRYFTAAVFNGTELAGNVKWIRHLANATNAMSHLSLKSITQLRITDDH